jgi:hypothetical protein
MTEHHPVLSGAVFDKESPFRHFPRDLDPTQRRFLEGIRFSVEMAQLSSMRLRSLVTMISLNGNFPNETETYPVPAASAFLDAWSMVDSFHRLRELFRFMPRLKKRARLLEIFFRTSSSVEPLRNRVQHLKGDLVDPKLIHLPVWGTLGWLWIIDLSFKRFLSGVLTAGPDTGQLRPMPIPGNRIFHDQLDHITLSVGIDEIDLSEVMRITIRLARSLEKNLKLQFEGLAEIPLEDMLMLVEIQTQDATASAIS